MKLQKALEQQKDSTEQVHTFIAGILGIPLNGKRQVEVQGRNAFLYVRLRNNQSEVIQAFNNQVSPSYNLPVLVERQGNRYVVVSVDTQRYGDNWTSYSSYLPRHGNTHSFDLESGGGGDIVWVQSRQIAPLLAMPSGSDGGPNVIINPYTLKNSDGTWKYIGNTGTQNLTLYNPSSPTGAIMALVYADSVSGNPYILVGSGTVFSNTITGTSAVAPYIPSVTNPAHIPLAAVRLITGSNALSWNNIYDVRQWLHTTPTGTGGSSGGGIDTLGFAGLDEGVPIGTGTFLNVVGAGATFTRSGTMFNLDIPGGGAGGAGVMAWDEGVPLGTGTVFNFVGGGVNASISGSVVKVFVTGSIGDAPLDGDVYGRSDGQWVSASVEVQEEGAFREGFLQKLNFVGGDAVDVSVSGTITRVAIENFAEDGFQGFGYNYQISESIPSGSFVFSLKTLAGANPSAADKLIFRIGNTRREITSSISHSLPTGTNLMNAGGAELAGKQFDGFIYLIQETGAAAGTKIGISRIPYARTMGDFVNTPTNEKYIAGNWTNFNSTDEVENIGRVRLEKASSTGGWQGDSSNIVSRPIHETDWLAYQPVYSANVGTWNTVTTNTARYKIESNTLYIAVDAVGTTSSTPNYLDCSLPFDAAVTNVSAFFGRMSDGGATSTAQPFLVGATPDVARVYRYDAAAYTAGAGRVVVISGFYQI